MKAKNIRLTKMIPVKVSNSFLAGELVYGTPDETVGEVMEKAGFYPLLKRVVIVNGGVLSFKDVYRSTIGSFNCDRLFICQAPILDNV